MDKRPLIIVSLCAVVLLVLGSSTSVLGYQTVQKIGRNRTFDQSENLLINSVENVVTKRDGLRHPFLLMIVWLYLSFHLFRGWILFELSISVGAFNGVEIKDQLLFLRACWLILLGEFWLTFWQQISSALGWNWPLDGLPYCNIRL